MFYHLTPKPALVEGVVGDGRLISALSVPVLDLDRSWFVEAGTGAVVLLGFAWVMWCLGGVWWREGYGKNESGVKKLEKKKQ